MNIGRIGVLMFALTAPLAATAQDAAQAPQMSAEQKAMMEAWEKASTPGEPHRQLRYFVGNWNAAQTMWMDPAAPPMKETATASFSSILDGRHLRMDYRGRYQGEPFEGVSYMGYDNVSGKHYGTWVDSVATGFFVARGDYDPASRTWTLHGEIHDPMRGGAMVPVREVTRIVDDNHFVFEWYETHEGKEAKMMQIDYTRAK